MKPAILFGKVMHRRLIPKINAFTYGIYYLAVPLAQIDALPVAVDRFGLLSFYRKDHGARDGGDLREWLRPHLERHGIRADGGVLLVALPRVLGYVFNPVSFWMCMDGNGGLRAVLCEVNNTFGETHSYLCAHADGRPIEKGDWLTGEKFFHVSPFMQRDGAYRFRFQMDAENFGVWIDHLDPDGRLQLATALTGKLSPMNRPALRRAFWRYPLVTLKAIALIHWQGYAPAGQGRALRAETGAARRNDDYDGGH